MRTWQTACAVWFGAAIFVAGCAQKASQYQPMDQVKDEAQKMSVSQLTAKAEAYKAEIAKCKKQLAVIQAKIKALKPTDVLSDAAGKLNDDVADVMLSITRLQERLQVYLDQLVTKGQDVTRLKAD